MRLRIAILACLLLASCAGLGAGNGNEESTMITAVRQIGGGIFNRNHAVPEQFTATRASLLAAGINRPVLVARLPDVGISVGLLEFQTPRGAIVWRSLDGNTITTAMGLLRNTRGFGTDLHSLETAPLERAFGTGQASEYSRVFRALDGENQVVVTRLYCHLQPEARENIDVLGRAYDTMRYREICHVIDHDTPVFDNTYWQGRDGTIWKSRQWAGPQLGYVNLERVNN